MIMCKTGQISTSPVVVKLMCMFTHSSVYLNWLLFILACVCVCVFFLIMCVTMKQ